MFKYMGKQPPASYSFVQGNVFDILNRLYMSNVDWYASGNF